MRLSTSFALLVLLPVSAAFVPTRSLQQNRAINAPGSSTVVLASESKSGSSLTASDTDDQWNDWADANGIVAPKLLVRTPLEDERNKGGVLAKDSIAALEVIARIPRDLILATCDMPSKAVTAAAEANEFSWAIDLTAATIAALHPDESNNEVAAAKKAWIEAWEGGGWGTDDADLGPPEADWGAKAVTGSLLATGSDNDHNIYAKFRFPCHPVIHRAALGLAMLTDSDDEVAREALMCRGRAFRAMRDALLPLVETPSKRKGSMRERRAWDVADALSRVLSRATALQLDNGEGDDVPNFCIVPLHERLAHCDERGENSKLVAYDDKEVLLVATRDISVGEAITRNYVTAPQLDKDPTDGALRLLLQFGLPPSAWPAEN